MYYKSDIKNVDKYTSNSIDYVTKFFSKSSPQSRNLQQHYSYSLFIKKNLLLRK
ncbi:hypothetical protein SAMN05421638_1403 [Kaistella treverensis]|uniref:Uncharacterized protein n=1 Tax=Kaistella treverensis TaxID=631455 RepID=A0A1I3LXQ2_9FLAO|nr:hypothetical protein SAMN05421638_1403 [Kaistella treverensis]